MMSETLTKLKISDLFIGEEQHRTDNVGKEVEELAESIRQRGLLQPIRVVPGEGPNKGKYSVVMGQRRFLACANYLKWDTIPAIISEKKDDSLDYLIDSVTENTMRLSTSNDEDRRVCVTLWRRFGNIQSICDITGLSRYFVGKHLKWDALSPELKELVDSGEVQLDAAYKAMEVSSYDDEQSSDSIVEMARKMNKLGKAQRDKVKKTKKQNIAADTNEIINTIAASKPLPIIQVTLTEQFFTGLQKMADDTQQTPAEAAHDIIVERLTDLGYGNEE